MTNEHIRLTIPSTTWYLGVVRRCVATMAQRIGFSDIATATLEMAVDEACTNCVIHTRPAPPSTQVAFNLQIELQGDRAGMTVIICDAGGCVPNGWEPAHALSCYMASSQSSGLGLHVIRKFVDELEYDYQPEHGNSLRLRKNLS